MLRLNQNWHYELSDHSWVNITIGQVTVKLEKGLNSSIYEVTGVEDMLLLDGLINQTITGQYGLMMLERLVKKAIKSDSDFIKCLPKEDREFFQGNN